MKFLVKPKNTLSMKTNQLNKEIQKLKLPDEQKSAILQIIDLKTEDNMEKVLNRMDLIQAEIGSVRDSMRAEISGLKGEIFGIKYMIGGLALLITIISIVLTIAFKFL